MIGAYDDLFHLISLVFHKYAFPFVFLTILNFEIFQYIVKINYVNELAFHHIDLYMLVCIKE